jgi:hypothetical protein
MTVFCSWNLLNEADDMRQKPEKRFGSDKWFEAQLLSILEAARARMENAYRDILRLHLQEVDYDKYVFLHIPKSQRKVWLLLRRLSAQHLWIKPWDDSDVLDLEPSIEVEHTNWKNAEEAAAKAAALCLIEAGIEAYVEVRYH